MTNDQAPQSAAGEPSVSIIMPHYNDLGGLNACLAALELQTMPSHRYEIIVVDNMSPCGEAAVRECVAGRARLIFSREKGAGPTRNAGIAEARHELLAFVDSDCVPAPGWLEAGIAALARADVIGGEMRVSVRCPGKRSGAEAFEQVFAFNNERYVRQEQFTVTANLFTRRALFDSVGGFRTAVSEDTDWCRRAVAAGYSIDYEPMAIMHHPARIDWGQLVRKWARIQEENFALMMERPRGRLRWLLRSFALPISIFTHAPRVLFTDQLDNLSERGRALATLVCLRLWRFANAQRLGLLAGTTRQPAVPRITRISTQGIQDLK